jgi:hypothetical protein
VSEGISDCTVHCVDTWTLSSVAGRSSASGADFSCPAGHAILSCVDHAAQTVLNLAVQATCAEPDLQSIDVCVCVGLGACVRACVKVCSGGVGLGGGEERGSTFCACPSRPRSESRCQGSPRSSPQAHAGAVASECMENF